MKKKYNDFNYLFDSVKETSEQARKNSYSSHVDFSNGTIKVMEESGELAAEALKLLDHKITKESKKQILKKIKSEAVDTLLATLDVLIIINTSKEEILKFTEKAISKWKKKHINPKAAKLNKLKKQTKHL
jgi:hypothetical protein